MNVAPSFPLTIYYDAACPLCASEMHALKEGDTNGSLILADCSGPDFDDRPFRQDGITRESMLRLIHARDANGHWLVGVDVFEAAYAAAGFSALAQLWGNRRLRPVLEKLYPWVAHHRYALSRLGLPKLFSLLTRNTRRCIGAPACSDGTCARDYKNRNLSQTRTK